MITLCLLVTLVYVAQSAAQLKTHIAHEGISENTINKIMQASNFTRRFNADKIDNDWKRELLDAGAPKWNQHSGIRAVLFHARKADLSVEHQAVLLSIAEVESGFNPIARAPTTSACGLFQFIKKTGKRYGLKREHCMDPWHNAETGIKHYVDNYTHHIHDKITELKGSERVFKLFELSYYLHHDGIDAATPSDKAESVILKGTPFLFKAHAILESELRSKEQITGTAGYLLNSVRDIARIVKRYLIDVMNQHMTDEEQQAPSAASPQPHQPQQ